MIKVFDAIKCAAATGNTLDIKFNREEVQELAERVKTVDWIEIHEGSLKEVFESCKREES